MTAGDHYGGIDMPYEAPPAGTGWDASSLVNPPVSGAMPLEHATLVQQPLPHDGQPVAED